MIVINKSENELSSTMRREEKEEKQKETMTITATINDNHNRNNRNNRNNDNDNNNSSKGTATRPLLVPLARAQLAWREDSAGARGSGRLRRRDGCLSVCLSVCRSRGETRKQGMRSVREKETFKEWEKKSSIRVC